MTGTHAETNTITMHLGDALAWLRTLETASVDAVITDPPYSSGGMVRGDRAGHTTKAKYTKNGTQSEHADFAGDNRDQRGWGYWMSLWLSEALRVTKPGGVLVMFCDWRQLPTATDVIQSGGWVWRGLVPWIKPDSRPQLGRFTQNAEFVAWGSNGPMPFEGDCLPGYYLARAPRANEGRAHITQKPVDVVRSLVRIAPRGGAGHRPVYRVRHDRCGVRPRGTPVRRMRVGGRPSRDRAAAHRDGSGLGCPGRTAGGVRPRRDAHGRRGLSSTWAPHTAGPETTTRQNGTNVADLHNPYGTREAHPYADLWPLLPDDELKRLADDIRVHGLREPVWLHPDGRIVDGRNRWRACLLAGVEPTTRVYQGAEEGLLPFLVSLNMARRHMDESQRAMVAAKIATIRDGGDRRSDDFSASIEALKQGDAAELMNVSRSAVQRARKVADHAAPELVEAVESGRVSVSAAAGLVNAPAEEQRRVAEVSKTESYKETQAAIQEARARIDVARVSDQHDRALWQTELPARVRPPKGKFSCIVIDPPWPMQKIEREERPDQGRELDYPVMSLDQIADENLVPVRTLAADDCHIYLWVTHKFLPAGMDLLDAWGFRYQCVMTWRKNVGITPFSWMYDTEHVLFGRRGDLKLERLGLRLSFEAPVQGHSAKPDVFYERVVEASPGPRVEMFSRRAREGFTVWGNEVADVV